MTRYVRSRVTINKSALKAIHNASISALEQTGDYVLGEVIEAQVMPFDTGYMQNESTYVDKKKSSEGLVSVTTSTPYTRRMYYHPEYNFRTDNNPNAKGKWLEDWTENGKYGKYAKDVKNAYAYFLKQQGGLK